jgi:4-hydroxy-tetrahydrodipicolinate reductase
MTIPVTIWGASGRMGRAIDEVAAEDRGVTIVERVSLGTNPTGTATDAGGRGVIIDFSAPGSAMQALTVAIDRRWAFVSGTTGLDSAQHERIATAAGTIPVLHAANMSMGVAVTRALVRQAARALPREFEPEIVEVHHSRKVDAPSGTALALARDVESARPESERVYGRQGETGARDPGELGVHALRGGDVVGEHTIYFFGQGERVEIAHRATDRRIFARGAVAAARWIASRPPGQYTFEDVLGL